MQKYLAQLRAIWRKMFFWHTPADASSEYVPEAHHDHALVLDVTEKPRVPRMRQLRFFSRVLDPMERRLFWISFVVFFLAVIVGTFGILSTSLERVPAPGGTLIEGLVGTPKLINPLYAPLNAVDRDLASFVYSGLFRLDASLEPQPDLAERYRWLPDGKTLEVTVRQDARFHDGVPVTADDIVFTYSAVKNPAWRSPLLSTFKGVTVIRVDDMTVQFQLEKPSPSFLTDLTLGILPAHIWQDVPDSGASLAEANLKPIGSGPYKLVSLVRDGRGVITSYHLEQFSAYYGYKPMVSDWQFTFFPDRDQAALALKNGQIDLFAFVPWRDAEDKLSPTVQAVTLELPQQTVAFFNTKDALLKDERVRQALDLAVDRAELQTLIGTHASLTSSPFPFLTATTATTPNLDLARANLDKIGWKLDPQANVRVLTPVTTGKTTTTAATSSTLMEFTIDVPEQPDLIKVAELLQRRWSLLGARVTIRRQPGDELRKQALANPDYQVIIWNVLLPPDQDLSQFWANAPDASRSAQNWSHLDDRDVDAAFTAIDAATTTTMLQQARQKLADTILSRSPALFLLRPSYAYLVGKRVQGIADLPIAQPSDRFAQTANWYVKTTWKWK